MTFLSSSFDLSRVHVIEQVFTGSQKIGNANELCTVITVDVRNAFNTTVKIIVKISEGFLRTWPKWHRYVKLGSHVTKTWTQKIKRGNLNEVAAATRDQIKRKMDLQSNPKRAMGIKVFLTQVFSGLWNILSYHCISFQLTCGQPIWVTYKWWWGTLCFRLRGVSSFEGYTFQERKRNYSTKPISNYAVRYRKFGKMRRIFQWYTSE